MAKNKQALIRYRIIDRALQHGRHVKSEQLLDLIAEELAKYDQEGISLRQLRIDITNMKSPELYDAPIEADKNGYFYSKRNFSITNCPITKEDADCINEALSTLEQFKYFGFYKELQGIIEKVAQKTKVYINPFKSAVVFESVPDYEGYKHLEGLYDCILEQKTIELVYQPFHDTTPQTLTLHPQLLKEHNNRWFLIAYHPRAAEKVQAIRPLPLDRIVEFWESTEQYHKLPPKELDNFFMHIIGVGLPWDDQTRHDIRLRVRLPRANYLLTKPLHHSQKVLSQTATHIEFSLQLIPNREFYAQILWFGADIEVLSPETVREAVKKQLQEATQQYS
jgi:predicted DNA-binding transcriptional regulator YafY